MVLASHSSTWFALAALQGDAEAPALRRTLQQRLNDPPLLAWGEASAPGGASPIATSWSSIVNASLPLNVHLLTLKAQDDGTLLLRLAHLYQVTALLLCTCNAQRHACPLLLWG